MAHYNNFWSSLELSKFKIGLIDPCFELGTHSTIIPLKLAITPLITYELSRMLSYSIFCRPNLHQACEWVMKKKAENQCPDLGPSGSLSGFWASTTNVRLYIVTIVLCILIFIYFCSIPYTGIPQARCVLVNCHIIYLSQKYTHNKCTTCDVRTMCA